MRDEDHTMRQLADFLTGARVSAALGAMADTLMDELRAAAPDMKSVFTPVPLELYGPALPAGIRSSWLFALRGGFAHPPERHPNSIQRMFALNEPGRFEYWDGARWVTRALVPGDRGLSIGVDVWHRTPAQDHDWVVVSFHTAEADRLIEIVGDPATGAIGSTRAYLTADGE